MVTTESTIDILATPQTVWAVIDDLQSYSQWSPIVPRLQGRTTVGEVVSGELVIPGMPTPPLTPTITKIVPCRELRWLSAIPGDEGFSAEHIFILEPTEQGTRLIHKEMFDGPAAPHLAVPIETLVHPAYKNFDRALKERAEKATAPAIDLHPHLSSAETAADNCVLECGCKRNRVEVTLSGPIEHNHLCGCSKCWKPEGALFAQTAVVASSGVAVIAHADRLKVVDDGQAIKRQACVECGVHMLGTVSDKAHHSYGLTFVHPELATADVATRPDFAGFVSSVIETGTSASKMEAIRNALIAENIPPFDAFSPEIMDVIAYHKGKIASTTSSQLEDRV